MLILLFLFFDILFYSILFPASWKKGMMQNMVLSTYVLEAFWGVGSVQFNSLK